MSAVPATHYTIQEYLAREKVATTKSEFYRGQIFAMSGASIRHNMIAVNVLGRLFGKLDGTSCRPFGSDQRVRVAANTLDTYPDVAVVCGEIERDQEDRNAIANPRVIFEVLSPSTENYNRGKKFDLYRDLASLQMYVLVSQSEPLVERFVRQKNGSWVLDCFKRLDDVVELGAIGCSLTLAEIYRGVEFGEEPEA